MTSSELFWFFDKRQVNPTYNIQIGITMCYISAFTTLLSTWLPKAIITLVVWNLRQVFSRNYGLKQQGKQRLNERLCNSCNLTIISLMATLDKSHHHKSCFHYLISYTLGDFMFFKRKTRSEMQVTSKRMLLLQLIGQKTCRLF